MGEFGGMTGQKPTFENHNALWEERWKAEARAARALEAFKLKDEEIETLQKQIAGFKVWVCLIFIYSFFMVFEKTLKSVKLMWLRIPQFKLLQTANSVSKRN